MRLLNKLVYKGFLIFFLSILFSSCATTDYQTVRKNFYSGKYDSAVSTLKEIYNESGDKDKLLYLLEAGTIFHTKADYKKSEDVFLQADGIASAAQTSASGTVASYVVNDNTTNYTGESFEFVMIKFYLALNRLFMGDPESARRYFRKVEYEQKSMKLTDEQFAQNLAARFIDAINSEALGYYNETRVQLNNLSKYIGESEVGVHRYILAVMENDSGDIYKYNKYSNDVPAYNASLEKVKLSRDMGQIVIINEAGKSARKVSRGKVSESPDLKSAFKVSLQTSLSANPDAAGISTTALFGAISLAENPIPKYDKPEGNVAESERAIVINGKEVGSTRKYTDYSQMAISNFNANYTSMVTRNVTSMAVKVVGAVVTAKVARDAMQKAIERQKKNLGVGASLISAAVGLGAGFVTGAVAGSLTKPDLRSWSLLPSNFQVGRLFLEPGNYSLSLPGTEDGGGKGGPVDITIEKGKTIYVHVRSLEDTIIHTGPISSEK